MLVLSGESVYPLVDESGDDDGEDGQRLLPSGNQHVEKVQQGWPAIAILVERVRRGSAYQLGAAR